MLALKKNCRVEYINRFSLLVDYTDGKDAIVYYEAGIKTLSDLYGTYKFRVKNEMEIDLFVFNWFPYPVKIS